MVVGPGVFLVMLPVHVLAWDAIGVTTLRAMTTNLDGTGIRVAQPEDGLDAGDPQAWVVDPAEIGQSESLFTYTSSAGSTNVFPNVLGVGSFHASWVGGIFYGSYDGVAPHVAHVDNFEYHYFISAYIAGDQVALGDPVVNQSYGLGRLPAAIQQGYDSMFDDYAVRFGTLFVSAVDNGNGVHAPATCYNGIGVAAYGTDNSSIGPTVDNGRCKPDICAPDYVTSFSTPQVAGSATVLLQAALRGDGGPSTNAASDLRTLKALLLNGAVKPVGWTNGRATPLDARYGAGVVNAYNAYAQLTGGKHGYNISNLITSGSAHLPAAGTGTVPVLTGWDFSTNFSASTPTARDGVNHYYFDATNSPDTYLCTATLAWNRQFGQTNINNLGLFLYNCANSNLVACSTSLVDNVQHVFATQLAPGRYDLQVWKAGGAGIVSATEPYALAFSFVAPKLTVSWSGSALLLKWPVYPAGLAVQANPDVSVTNGWNTAMLPDPVITNGEYVIPVNPSSASQFFRLGQP